MFKKMRQKMRHEHLMDAVRELVIRAEETPPLETYLVTADQVRAYVFGQYQLRIDEEEATEYLRAVLVARGHSISHLVVL